MKIKTPTLVGLTGMLIVSIMTGCHSSGDSEDELDDQLRGIIQEKNLSGNPNKDNAVVIPDINMPLAQLGMKLFFSKALGGDMDAACVTCHHPVLGGGDNLTLPIGTSAENPELLGPGRAHKTTAQGYDGGPTVPRNSPTTYNIALWKQGLFWDSRVEKMVNGNISTPDSGFDTADTMASDLVSAQARFPVTSDAEMRGFTFEQDQGNEAVRNHLAARLGDYGIGVGYLENNQWRSEFEAVYGAADPDQLVSFERVVDAIAAYEKSQFFINTPWKAYIEGDANAINESAKQGALLFYRPLAEGGANCVECHSGDFFTDERFHVLGTAQVGRGKGVGEFGDDDFGRFLVTDNEQDLYAFRTSTLLNVAQTGPWGHAGAYSSLEAIVRQHLNPVKAFDNYDYQQLDPGVQTSNTERNTRTALAKLQTLRQQGDIKTIQDVELSDEQVADLVSFLEALTDPCVTDRNCLAKWMPNENTSNPDGERLNAKNVNGSAL